MAVPKKRTSRARRDKRRATHAPAITHTNECPRCHSPRLPHRVCPTCGTYAGREIVKQKPLGGAESGSGSSSDA